MPQRFAALLVTLASVVMLGIAAWVLAILQTGFVSGESRTAELVIRDYVMLAVVYVPGAALALLVNTGGVRRSQGRRLRAITVSVLAIAAMCVANVLVETRQDGTDDQVASTALLFVVVPPLLLFGARTSRVD